MQTMATPFDPWSCTLHISMAAPLLGAAPWIPTTEKVRIHCISDLSSDQHQISSGHCLATGKQGQVPSELCPRFSAPVLQKSIAH
ncbi:hypothetical protein PVAP13_5NG012554 [Panicum virgatum]|uniref:Uncharacterized protein n=1 Tax=Panicum virgatum TaxID=38727 RepID=A0A8T0S952_PANVG|nr:hypothetical protein PVAP13_5NG012554 [Panicum virgatum]